MYIKCDLCNYQLEEMLWSEGYRFYNRLSEHDKTAVLDCLERYYNDIGETPALTDINDLFWFEPNTVFQMCVEYGLYIECLNEAICIYDEMPDNYEDKAYLEQALFEGKYEDLLWLTVWRNYV